MALIKCSECGHQIAKSAKTCPNCGAANKARTGCIVQGLAVLLAIIVIGSIAQSCEESQKANNARETTARANQTANAKKAKEENERKREVARLAAMSPNERAAEEQRISQEREARKKLAADAAEAQRKQRLRDQGLMWVYGTQPDDLTGKDIHTARLKSINTVEFDFPYAGAQRATLTLRKHPRYGIDAILSVERGQFLCEIDGCSVAIVVDGGNVEYYSAGEPSDHDTTFLFIRNESRFIRKIKAGKTARISATFYQEGSPAFEFNVEDLDWDSPTSQSSRSDPYEQCTPQQIRMGECK